MSATVDGLATGVVVAGGAGWLRTTVVSPPKAPASASTPTTTPTETAPAMKESNRLIGHECGRPALRSG
jgi:hypothetical protein